MPKKLTTEVFIIRSEIIHDCKYDYSKVEYINNSTNVVIKCPIHGEFEQRPIHHLNGSGCPNCTSTKKLTIKKFIEKSIAVHGNKYDYSSSTYSNNLTKIKIICPIHGEFEQWPKDHYSGSGCPSCYDSKSRNSKLKKDLSEFIIESSELKSNKYDYSKFEYVNSKTKGIIICPIHGEFEQSPNSHLSGSECPKCSIENSRIKISKWQLENRVHNLTQSEFIHRIKEINQDKIVVSGDYINSSTLVKMKCLDHGEFFATPNNLLYSRSGCPTCSLSLRTSKSEFEIIDIISSFYSGEILQSYRPNFLMGQELDIFIPEFNFAIEFNGGYWHSDKYKDRNYHFNKWKACHDNGIRLLVIWDFYWANEYKMEIYISKIKHFLKMDTVIYGRKCFIKEIDKFLAINFIKENHLEGFTSPYLESSYIGLYESDNLLMVCIYGKTYSQTEKKLKWKIQRIATKLGYTVAGGVSKILKYIESKKINAQFQITLDTGGSLFVKKTVTKKDVTFRYWWVKGLKYLTRNSTQISILKNRSDWISNDTEKSYMERNGYYRVFDSGIVSL